MSYKQNRRCYVSNHRSEGASERGRGTHLLSGGWNRSTPSSHKLAWVTSKKLTDKVDDMENRNRRNNLRLVGLPEKEGNDACAFLEAWIPKILEMDSSTSLIIERIAYRVGTQRNLGDQNTRRDASTSSRTLIMKFMNFRQKEQVLRVARSKGTVSYKEHTLRFHPDVSAEVHRELMILCVRERNQ